MDNQVILLKKKVRQLEHQLCQRTRNYLYHFKKSPGKQKINTKQQQCQTQYFFIKNEQSLIEQTPHQNNDSAIKQFRNILLSQTGNSKNNVQHQTESKTELQIQNSQKSKHNNNNPVFNLQKSDLQLNFRQQNQRHQEQIESLSAEIRLMKQQLEKTKTPKNKNSIKVQLFTPSEFITFNHQQNMVKSYPQKFNTIDQQSSIKHENSMQYQNSSVQYQTSQIQCKSQVEQQQQIQNQHLRKQLKILKKQVRKFRQHLQYQIKASNQTKQALLISQQENYKFRLKIQQLNKQIKLFTGIGTQSNIDKLENYIGILERQQNPFFKQNDSEQSCSTKQQLEKFKYQSQKYEQHISILQGVKKDYLNKCIQAKQEIYRLKVQNQKLKYQIIGLKHKLFENDNIDKKFQQKILTTAQKPTQQQQSSKLTRQQYKQVWQQVFKQKVHQISNCLPILNKNENIFVFRPQTVEDLISMLQRILQFCKNIQRWQKQKIQAIQRQRSNLLKIISSVLIKHPNTKHTIAEQISEIRQLSYLVNFLNRQPNKSVMSSIYSSQNIIQAGMQVQKQQFVETN